MPIICSATVSHPSELLIIFATDGSVVQTEVSRSRILSRILADRASLIAASIRSLVLIIRSNLRF
jgi:hypothetical protein